MNHLFEVELTLSKQCFPHTALFNSICAKSAFEAAEKVLKHHQYKPDDIIEIFVRIKQGHPMINNI